MRKHLRLHSRERLMPRRNRKSAERIITMMCSR
ncbi:hypothetical protein SRIMHP_02220 [Streptomyces rimosus subsp. rimosus]|uniref:Transposase n=1 Tax=Streptomyces rimosus subsp. rimosus TaxID=132474 RepID=A0ABY3YU71_STRRM|nr:hypothetical protein SRIMR7_02220 [Streptomyces rimosus subsp. rimosus]UTH92927.1 hypothetical protein SRIMHP_02220 [Streptomyces rimosus subsp. rimosus]UTJ11043.1 hypothetical protein SRIMDV3_02220 [Streptomyces rimosus subsp. rimosus]